MSDVDDLLRKHYAKHDLTDRQVDRILAGGNADGRTYHVGASPRRWVSIAAVAALALLLAGALFWTGLRPDLTEAIAAEVAYNYAKGTPPEVRSERYEVIQTGLDRLDFSIMPLRDRLLRDFDLEGGRYCSVRDVLAAQLHMRRRDTGDMYALYVVPVSGELSGVDDSVRHKDGTRIELWQDDGRLFALAGPSPASTP